MAKDNTLQNKLSILSGAARYDVSCASSGSRRGASNALGSTLPAGVCHSWSADGRCVSLLKILFSNQCRYNCQYCPNRCSNDIPRASFTPEEVVRLTLDFYKRNYIEGLFLSSGVRQSVDETMMQMVEVARVLRKRHHFNGYLHLKVLPGTSAELVRLAGFYADRLSVNVELPSEASLRRLAPEKNRQDIFRPMAAIGEGVSEYGLVKRQKNTTPRFSPAGHSTQLIVGASPEPDGQILHLSQNLYKKFLLKRVYYSAYIPVNDAAALPVLAQPPLLREHRLYQADWLLRFYGFQADELLPERTSFLDLELDPKASWALQHPEAFPVDVNRAELELLLRVPGVGLQSARRIVRTRQVAPIREEDLKRMGVVMKRAAHFLCIRGRKLANCSENPSVLRTALMSAKQQKEEQQKRQLLLF